MCMRTWNHLNRIGCFLTILLSSQLHAAKPVALRCDGMEQPVGWDRAHPSFSWKLDSSAPQAMQTAYQIQIDGLWDSGKVADDRSVGIAYRGDQPLVAGRWYQWRVRVWDENDQPGPWSAPARWSVGKLTEADWSADWISMPDGPASAPIAAADLRVRRATYQTLDGKVKVDVTPQLSQAVAAGKLPFAVDFNQLGGDPAFGVAKELVVEYTLRGIDGVSRARDFANLSIPPVPEGNPAIWFRGECSLPSGKLESATLTVHTPGYFEVHLNGNKVGTDVLAPAISDVRHQTFTRTYDVAAQLQGGLNAVGLWCARGWGDRVVVRAQLDAVIDGKPFRFGTGTDWKAHPSHVSHIGGWSWSDFGGERIDANADVPNWARPGLDVRHWRTVAKAPAPNGTSRSQEAPANQIGAKIPAACVTELADGRWELDFGTNLSGWLQLRLPRLPAGRVVRLHFADRLFPDGVHASPIGNISISRGSCTSFRRKDGGENLYQTMKQVSEWVSAGRSGEVFCHRFNYAAFRYVVVEGLDTPPTPSDATALLVESALPQVGTFECSDPLLNRIHRLNQWTQRCLNLGGYYVDCPHRERMGYGDGQVMLPGLMMNFDSNLFLRKWVADWDLALERHEGGEKPNVAPPLIPSGGGPPWPGIIVALPWQHYLHYGEISILEQHYPDAKRYIEYLDSRATGDVLRAWGSGFSFIGDWVPPNRGMDTNQWPNQQMAELFCNCYRIYLWQMVGDMAHALGRKQEAEHARQRCESIRRAVHAAFYDAAQQRYVCDEQIYYAFPLWVGVTPPAERPAVLANLRRCLVEKNRGHLDTGMLGTTFLLKCLDHENLQDLILGIYQKKDYPGWGYMVEQGATTMWEQWNGHWSQVHSCFTSADNWLYHGLAGIRPDPAKPGFKNVILQPAVTCGLQWVKASHDGPYGTIQAHWKRNGKRVRVEAIIPPNSTATLILPDRPPQTLKAGSHTVEATLP